MNYGIQYLAHLVQTKNDLNRKRRRFYEIGHPKCNKQVYDRRTLSYRVIEVGVHYAYSKMEAERGYRQAQQEMKAMTKHMREVRTELSAHFVWSNHGAISAIKLENARYETKDIARLAKSHVADTILLGD